MKVVVTGGAGFVGLHLARRLAARGDSVTLVDSFERAVRDRDLDEVEAMPGVSVVGANLLDPRWADHLGDDHDAIVHLAAIIGVRHVLERPYSVLADNASMTTGVIDFARRQRRLGHLVFASTSEVYAGSLLHLPDMAIPTPETTPIALTAIGEPRTSYMLSKLYGEALVAHSGVPATSVRLHNVYGPRMGLSHVVPELLQRTHDAADGDTLTVGNLDHRRAFCHVDDAISMFVGVLDTPATVGATLNVGNAAAEVTIRDVAECVVSTVGRRLSVVPGVDAPGSPARRCPDTALIESLTGVRATIGLAEGVASTYRWYRERVFSGGPSAR